MSNRIPFHFGSWLSIAAAALTNAFQGGKAVALEGTEEIDVEVLATFDAATTLTSIDYQIQVSDDGTNWEPIVTYRAGLAPSTSFSLAASAGNTVRDRLTTTGHRVARQTRIATKFTGGSPSGADASNSNLNFDSF